jgi:hypothetical protein
MPGHNSPMPVLSAKKPGRLTAGERLELERRRSRILDGLRSIGTEALAVGQQLRLIHGKRLFREHGTWAAFCADLFGRSRHYGYRLMRLAEVAERLGRLAGGEVQLSSGVAEELAALPEELQLAGYQLAGGDDATVATAREVREALTKAAEKGDEVELKELQVAATGKPVDVALARARYAPVKQFRQLFERAAKITARLDERDAPAVGLVAVDVVAELPLPPRLVPRFERALGELREVLEAAAVPGARWEKERPAAGSSPRRRPD